MDLILRLFGTQLVVSIGPADPPQESYQVTTSDHQLGFAPPVEYFFTDDEE